LWLLFHLTIPRHVGACAADVVNGSQSTLEFCQLFESSGGKRKDLTAAVTFSPKSFQEML
jgi:hypothetical protein